MVQEITTSSIVSLFDTTKEERSSFVLDLVNRITDGQLDPIKAHYSLKCMEEILKNILNNKDYKDCLLMEAEKHGKKFSYRNSELQIKEAGVKYDYSHCGHHQLLQLQGQVDALNEQVKAYQEFLKKVPTDGMEIVIEDEVVRVYPPAKSSTTTLTVTLK